MDSTSYRIVRTLRCKNSNVPGTLGQLTTVMGSYSADIGNIMTVHIGHHFTVRDIEILVDSEKHLQQLLDKLAELPNISVLEVRDEVLELHKSGKIKVMNTTPINNMDILRKIYTPGVAEVCELINREPDMGNTYTGIPYSVAIVTDGTAILGLGNIGPVAGMPVMESKSALLQQLVGVSGVPVLLNTTDTDEIIEAIKHISPTFSGIHLEDISSPRCFPIEEKLTRELDIPVMHDDQWGTAVVTLAALLNACRLCHVDIQEARIGLIGLGAAGLSIGKFLHKFTGKASLGAARTEASTQRHVEHGGIASNLDEIMRKCNIVIATTGQKGLIEPGMVQKGQIIFALSNPYPEIMPDKATGAGAALATDGRTVNNILAYPGIWRGLLDARASKANYEVYRAAAMAIADATSDKELIPNPLDPKVHLAVTHSVARAAVASGVAQRQLDDDYFENKNVKEPPWI